MTGFEPVRLNVPILKGEKSHVFDFAKINSTKIFTCVLLAKELTIRVIGLYTQTFFKSITAHLAALMPAVIRFRANSVYQESEQMNKV
ncbi:hypothetical protein BpHYR1_014749 [Brachionus plicatilis]|uniref:Uncharacterized protein n=1 Tax=Brachionus plicatilis TaxID=10195 RepID=A0A3M7S3S0_BRAPC|nr:hypothetical protein BpHYR1_014749 [Brachionus plicatilis]